MSESSDDEEGRFNKFKTTRSPDKTKREDCIKDHSRSLENSKNSSIPPRLKNTANVRLKNLRERLVNDAPQDKSKLTNTNKPMVNHGYGKQNMIESSSKCQLSINGNADINSKSAPKQYVRSSGHTIYPWIQPINVTPNDLIHLNLPTKYKTKRNPSNNQSVNDRIAKIRNLQRNGETQIDPNSKLSRKRPVEGDKDSALLGKTTKKMCPMVENTPYYKNQLYGKSSHLPSFSQDTTTSNKPVIEHDIRTETKVAQCKSVPDINNFSANSSTTISRSVPLAAAPTDQQEELPNLEINAKLARTAMWVNHVANKQHLESSSASISGDHALPPTEKVFRNAGTSTTTSAYKMDWEDLKIAEETTKADPVINESEIQKISGKSKDICLVVDTNVFINSLSKIEDIMDMEVEGESKPVLLIPWMVITELDFMKDSCFSTIMRANISRSVKLINKALEENNPRMIGQTVFEMDQQRHIGVSQDDKIMACCLQAAEKYETVILLSNDINLKNKSMINGIKAVSSNDIMMKLMFKLELNVKYLRIKQKMSTLWTTIISKCAEDTYGKIWNKMNLLSNPPWSVVDCLKIFKKYWQTLFKEKVMKQFIKAVDDLSIFLSNRPCIKDNSKDYVDFVKMCISLCIFLKDIEETRENIRDTLSEITKIG